MAIRLKVSAASGDGALEPVKVNDEGFLVLESNVASIKLAVRIRDYTVPDESNDEEKTTSSEYFSLEEHASDNLSIQFSVVFKKGNVNGNNLLWGNDFDEPIRDMLPYGFSVGYGIFKYAVDPSVDGDVYADKPFLYGRALTSINAIADKGDDKDWPGYLHGDSIEIPDSKPLSSKERMSAFRNESLRKEFEFEQAHQYCFDFFTPYLSLGKSFSVKLPGFNFDVGKYCNKQPLRYRLIDKVTDTVYLSVVFELQNSA